MVDESFSDENQIPLAKAVGHAVNIKLEKAGGAIRAVRSALSAKKEGLGVMLGSMVVSNLGCNQVYALSPLVDLLDVDGCLLIDSPLIRGGFKWSLCG